MSKSIREWSFLMKTLYPGTCSASPYGKCPIFWVKKLNQSPKYQSHFPSALRIIPLFYVATLKNLDYHHSFLNPEIFSPFGQACPSSPLPSPCGWVLLHTDLIMSHPCSQPLTASLRIQPIICFQGSESSGQYSCSPIHHSLLLLFQPSPVWLNSPGTLPLHPFH